MLDKIAEKYIKDNTELLNKVVTELKSTFTKIDALQTLLIKIEETDISNIRKIGKDLNGYNAELQKVANNLHALRHNKRVAFYYKRVLE